MASQVTFDQLIAYYVNLLIIQYSGGNQPKAQAHITLLAYMMMAADVYSDVENGYNIDPSLGNTAVGVQLDVIGKYLGVDRFFTALDLINYFGLIIYSEDPSSLPTSPPVFGACTYATFGVPSYNGTLLYNDIITSENALNDTDFLLLLQFMAIINNINYSAGNIDAALWKIFGPKMWAETVGQMAMTYFIVGPVTTLLNTMIFKKLLPAPTGVLINIVQNITGPMFGIVSYAQQAQGVYSVFAFGCSSYSNYATLSGQVLTYSQITQE